MKQISIHQEMQMMRKRLLKRRTTVQVGIQQLEFQVHQVVQQMLGILVSGI